LALPAGDFFCVVFARGDAFFAGLGDFAGVLLVATVFFAGVFFSGEAAAFFGEAFFAGAVCSSGEACFAGDAFLVGEAFFAGDAFLGGVAFFVAGEALVTRPALTLPRPLASCALAEGVVRRGDDLVAFAGVGDSALLAFAGDALVALALAGVAARAFAMVVFLAGVMRDCLTSVFGGVLDEVLQSVNKEKGLLWCNQNCGMRHGMQPAGQTGIQHHSNADKRRLWRSPQTVQRAIHISA